MGIWTAKCHCPATPAIVKPTSLLNHSVGEDLLEGGARIAQLLEMIPAHAHSDATRIVAYQPPDNAQLEERRISQYCRPTNRQFHMGSVCDAFAGMKQNATAAHVSGPADAPGNDLVPIDDSEFQIQLEGVAPL